MKQQGEESKRTAFLSGIKMISPLLVGVFPFGAIAGISIVDAGVDTLPAIMLSIIVFAGASQIAIADLIGKGAPFFVIILTAVIINLRFVMYSASIAPHFKKAPTWAKYILAYLLTDHAYALSISRFNRHPEDPNKIWFYTGCAVFMWVIWQIGTILGVYLGLQVPKSWSLGFAIPLSFLALLIPNIKDLAAVLAALVSGLIALVGLNLPLNMGIILAAVCGILTGFTVETCLLKRNRNNGC